jgi:TP901 family phage tail tape measure protein
MGNLPPVRVELIAEIKEFLARMKEAEHGLGKVGDKANYTKEKMGALGQKMATGVLAGVGGTMILATKFAYEYQASLEKIGFQANVSEEEMKRLHHAVLETSSATATSAEIIANAYLSVEKAGIKGAAADEMVTQAAKLAKVAHADLNQTISAGIVIQQLGIAKGMNSVQMYDALYGAIKNSKLSLDDLTGVFQGKAALAISNYGLKLGEVAGVAGVFKKANMDAGAGMAGLQLALGKLTTRNAKANDTLKTVGLTQAQIAADLKKPNGLVTMLGDLATHVGKSGLPLQQFLNGLVGIRGAQGVGFLIKQIDTLKSMSGEGGVSVKNAFAEWLKNPEGALENFKTVAKNTLIGLGDLLLPKVSDGLNFLNAVINKFQTNKTWHNAGIEIGTGLLTIITSAKLASWGVVIAKSFGVETAGLVGPIGVGIAASVAGVLGIKKIVDQNKNWLSDFNDFILNMVNNTASPTPSAPSGDGTPTPNKPKKPLPGLPAGQTYVTANASELATDKSHIMTGSGDNVRITNAQLSAALAYVQSQKIDINTQQGNTILSQILFSFQKQDKKGNYAVTVNIN